MDTGEINMANEEFVENFKHQLDQHKLTKASENEVLDGVNIEDQLKEIASDMEKKARNIMEGIKIGNNVILTSDMKDGENQARKKVVQTAFNFACLALMFDEKISNVKKENLKKEFESYVAKNPISKKMKTSSKIRTIDDFLKQKRRKSVTWGSDIDITNKSDMDITNKSDIDSEIDIANESDIYSEIDIVGNEHELYSSIPSSTLEKDNDEDDSLSPHDDKEWMKGFVL